MKNIVRNHGRAPLRPHYPHRLRREALTVTDAEGNHRLDLATADLLDAQSGEALVRCSFCQRWERHVLPADIVRGISATRCRDAAA